MKMIIGMYLRLSSEDRGSHDESNSIRNQRLLIRDYIRRQSDLADAEVLEYCDDGYSGTNMERPGLQELLKEVKANKINCIIVKDLSRFSRDYIEAGTYLNQIFPFMMVRFIAINDNYDSLNRHGQTTDMDVSFRTMINDFYAKDTSIKVKAGIAGKYEAGECWTSSLPLGYMKAKGTKDVVVCPEEAVIVRKIFDLALDGLTSGKIAKKLNDEGIPTASVLRKRKLKEGQHPVWERNIIRKILNNRFYCGDLVYHKYEVKEIGSSKSNLLPKNEWNTVTGHHEALITEEEHRKVVRYSQTGNVPVYPGSPLTGKLICGGCGYHIRRMISKSCRPVKFYYGCIRKNTYNNGECAERYRAELIEELVLTELYKEMLCYGNPEESYLNMKRHADSVIAGLKKDAEICETETGRLNRSLRDLYMLYNNNEISEEEYRQRKEAVSKQCRALSEKMRETEERIDHELARAGRLEENMKAAIRYSGIKNLTKEVVDTFIDRIYLYSGKRIKIVWKFSTEGDI